MTETIDIHKDLEALLGRGSINGALDMLDNTVTARNAELRVFAPELERLRQSYGYMAEYALKGLPDPGLPDSYAALMEEIRSVADLMARRLKAIDAPTLYFSNVRTDLLQPGTTIGTIIGEYRRVSDRRSLAALAENPENALRDLTYRAESLEKRFFNSLWITAPLSAADAEALRSLLADRTVPAYFKMLAVSGILMGLMEIFDERRMLLLADYYREGEAPVALRALCALLIGMWIYRNRPMGRRLRLSIGALADMPQWRPDVRMVTMQFIRARDTERITRKFQDEVIPEMMKLRPEIEKLGQRPLDPDAIEENPEWAELLEKSGVADRLKELQEIQEEGGDVMMATFSKLKTFPFFNDISNWFLPFHPSHSLLTCASDPQTGALCSMLTDAPMLCDSDKYSAVLSIAQIPAAQRDMMLGQLRMQSEQLEQIRLSALDPAARKDEEEVTNYVRCLYRFFKLFRRKGEFTDPFAIGLNLPSLPQLEGIFDDEATLRLIGEFYFNRRYYEDAYATFERLSLMIPPSAELFQKMGYCMQAAGNIPEALRLYEQSELLRADSRWTMRRLAACHRHLGNWEKALGYYRRLAETKPDDVNLALNIGLCLVKLHRYEEALQQLFKAEFLGNRSPKAMRAIAWCTLLGEDYGRCRKYISLLLSDSPTPDDMLNAGHLEMLTGHYSDAADRYASHIAATDFDNEAFLRSMSADTAAIPALGRIAPELIHIVADKAVERSRLFGHPL